MSHVVIYRPPSGPEAHLRVADAAEALAAVERLRNEDGVESATIYELREVPFSLEPYYRARLAGDPEDAPEDAPEVRAEDQRPAAEPPRPRSRHLLDEAPVGEPEDFARAVADLDLRSVDTVPARRGLFAR